MSHISYFPVPDSVGVICALRRYHPSLGFLEASWFFIWPVPCCACRLFCGRGWDVQFLCHHFPDD